MPKRSTAAKNLDDDEKNIYENLNQLNIVTEQHGQQQAEEHSQQQAEEYSQQQARRVQATSGEKNIANSRQKSTANSRREEHTQPQVRIKRTERAVQTAGRDV